MTEEQADKIIKLLEESHPNTDTSFNRAWFIFLALLGINIWTFVTAVCVVGVFLLGWQIEIKPN
tara:strand:+ start:433 stop:624 length:192 start_codon:yes stop_codon:yes gene_type:complete